MTGQNIMQRFHDALWDKRGRVKGLCMTQKRLKGAMSPEEAEETLQNDPARDWGLPPPFSTCLKWVPVVSGIRGEL